VKKDPAKYIDDPGKKGVTLNQAPTEAPHGKPATGTGAAP
jgi:hypothetical protein